MFSSLNSRFTFKDTKYNNEKGNPLNRKIDILVYDLGDDVDKDKFLCIELKVLSDIHTDQLDS